MCVECLKGKTNAGESADSATATVAVNGNLEELQRLVEAGLNLDGGDSF